MEMHKISFWGWFWFLKNKVKKIRKSTCGWFSLVYHTITANTIDYDLWHYISPIINYDVII